LVTGIASMGLGVVEAAVGFIIGPVLLDNGASHLKPGKLGPTNNPWFTGTNLAYGAGPGLKLAALGMRVHWLVAGS
jgi:hypothetical protein